MILSKDNKFKELLKGFQFGGSGKILEDGNVIAEDWFIESRSMSEKEFRAKIDRMNEYVKENYPEARIKCNKVEKMVIHMAPLESWEDWEPYDDIFMECFYKVEY